MSLLLDTCTAIWIAAGAKIAAEAARLIDESVGAARPVYVSPISA